MTSRWKLIRALGLGALSAAAACSSSHADSPTDAATDAGADAAADLAGEAACTGQGDPTTLAGRFLVQLTPAVAGGTPVSSVAGKVYDRPQPVSDTPKKQAEDGPCTLYLPHRPFCDPRCESGTVCAEGDTCQPEAKSTPVGTVTVKGLRDAAGPVQFAMTPINGSYSQPATVTLAHPPFAEADDVTFEAAGCQHRAFTLTAKGIAPLSLSSGEVPLEDGKPLSLAWSPPKDPGLTTIDVKLDISHHGGSRGHIACTTDDDGALTIGADLVSQLYKLGLAGYPTVIVTRRTAGGTAVGQVRLVAESVAEVPLKIPGLSSCTDDSECQGRKCRADLTCECAEDAHCPAGKKCQPDHSCQ